MLLSDLEVEVLNNDVTGIAVSAWRCFSLLASAVILSQRGISCIPLVMDDSRMFMWDYVLCRSLHPIRNIYIYIYHIYIYICIYIMIYIIIIHIYY